MTPSGDVSARVSASARSSWERISKPGAVPASSRRRPTFSCGRSARRRSTSRRSRVSSRVSYCATALEGADARIAIVGVVALAGVVVPVEPVRVLAARQLVRAVAVRLILRQAALAQPHLLAFDDVLGRFLQRALDETWHRYSSLVPADALVASGIAAPLEERERYPQTEKDRENSWPSASK